MGSVLNSIDYKGIFKFFEEICGIPHGSKNNKEISDYLISFAKSRGLECHQDEYLNVVIVKEATKGYEDKPTVIIQGHMDMVCEKRPEIEHDFIKDGLELVIDGDFIHANGTTLGGDDGIAVAYALAILDDDSLIHPRLEVVVTTDEEIGMDGAAGLDTSSLQGKYFLNIDSEEEGILLSSSAGGLTGTCTIPLEFEEKEGSTYQINISGLQGGHSGAEIHKNRTNASLLMGRLLFDLGKKLSYSLVEVNGGLKDNTIPRESTAKVLIKDKDKELLKETMDSLTGDYTNELKTSEPGLKVELELLDEKKAKVLNEKTYKNVMTMLLYTPNGVQAFSSDIEGLVESSLNLGILSMEDDKIIFSYSVRSSLSSYKRFLSDKLENLAKLLGGTYIARGDYAAWEYKKDSKLRDTLVKVYKEDYGEEPKIEAIHAGLECGLFAGKMKDLDLISFGPDMYDIHTPDEKLSISSAKRVFDFLVHSLEALCEVE